MLWIDGATVTVTGSPLVVYGKFRITAGSYSTTGTEGAVIREEGQYLIEGGTFTTEKFRPSTTASTHRGSFIMTGGTFNATGTGSNDGYARFSHPYPEQVFIMSGGVLNVSNSEDSGNGVNGGIHIGSNPSSYNVTGGTINAILSGAATYFYIASTAPLYNLNISRPGSSGTSIVRLAGIGSLATSITAAQPLTILNDLTIDGTNNPVVDARGLTVTVGRHFTITNGATYTPSSNTTVFNGAADQSFSNSGTISPSLFNMTVNKSAGTLTLAGSATTFTVAQTLSLNDGILNDGGRTLEVAGNIYNEAVHSGTGNITLNGATTQTISGDGTGIFGNLILNNASTPGANCTSDLTISGAMTLAGTGNSLFDISQYTLSITSTSASAITTTGNGFSTSKMIRTSGFHSDGGVKKTYGNLNAFTYPVGTTTNYTPSTIQLTAAPTTYGSITVRPVASRHPFVVAGNTNNLAWYWKASSAGFAGLPASSVNHSYNYLDIHVTGGDASYVPARFQTSGWTVISDVTQVNETTNVISFANVSYIDGDFTAGFPAAFGTVRTFYSIRNGVWTDTNPGTTPWSTVSHSGTDASAFPVDGDNVFIGDGGTHNHTITITSNGQASGGLEISSGSILDVSIYTGHNFGTFENTSVSGSGLLRISSSTATAEFPAGDFGNFIRASGGTVEYYSTASQDFTIPLSSASPTLLPLISYKNLTLSPGAGRFIRMPNQDLRIYGNLTVQGAASSGVAHLNSVNARTMTINGNIAVTGGNLQFQSGTPQTIDLDGGISVSTGAIFDVSPAGTTTHIVLVAGSLVNNGTFDMYSTSTSLTNVTFTSAANTSITGTGATTDFSILTVDKGTSQTPVLNVNATAFSLSGGSAPLILLNGTFRLSSSQTVTIANGVDFNIPSTSRLSANGGTFQTTAANNIDLLLAGTLEILAGGVNVGTTSNDNSIEYAATGTPTLTASAGTLNVQGQIRRSSASAQGTLQYNQSGPSVVSVGLSAPTTLTRGVFEILNSGSSFIQSGGTLRINNALNVTAIADLYLQASSFAVTGGTVEIGGAGTSLTIDVNTIIPLFNLSVTGTTNNAHLELNPLTLRGSLSINAGNTFQASGFNVSIAGNFSSANTDATTNLTSGGFLAGSTTQTTTFNGSTGHQTISGVAGNLTNFANLTISNTFTGGIVTLLANTNLRIHRTLILSSGTVAGGANTITALSTVSNSSTHTSSAGGSITLAGSSSQTLTGSGTGRFGDLILSNTNGAVFGANQEITGTLTFMSGHLNIGPYNLNLSNTSLTAIVGSTSAQYIITSGNLSDGGMTKAFAASVTNGNFIYPIGVSGKYTPANYTISTGAIGGNITIRPVNSKHPSATGSGTAYIRYYWSVTHSVILLNNLTHTYTYSPADENGTLTDYRDARFKSGAWTIGTSPGNPDTGNRIITFTNTDLAGDYTCGEATAFVNPTTYTSIASGDWESDLSVWDIDPPGLSLGPPAGSFVIISAGHTVTVTNNSKQMATLEVRGRLNLGNTIGHDFGTVSTSGAGVRTIQIQSSTFPSGDFSTFHAASGGTVEYNGAVVLPTQNTYNNLSFTGSGSKTLPNADLTINGNFSVLAGTANNAVNNRSIVLVSATGDLTNNGIFIAGSGVIIVGRNLINSGSGVVFNAGNGSFGLRITGNLTNSTGATFNVSTDSVGVRGFLNNSATFNVGAGEIHVTKDINNTSGTFSGGSGVMAISGSVNNSAAFNAGGGNITVRTDLSNSGAAAVYTANANTLSVAGNFTNSSSATFNANTSSTFISGNFTNTATFTANTSMVTFNGAGVQQLTGATNFYNLRRTNGGSLILNSNVNASAMLTLSSGNIITGSNVLSLTNTAAQPASGYSASSFIDGSLSITFPNTAATSRIYPVGKGSIYRPVTLQQTAASSSAVVRIEMINTPPTGSYPVEVSVLSEARYYAMDLLSGTLNAPTVELNFNTNSPADENVAVPANARVLRSLASSGPWTDQGGTGVFSPASPAGYVTSGVTSIVSSTFFALGYQTSPLPISLQTFQAHLSNEVVHLNWTTLTEKSNAYFTVERSGGGEFYFQSVVDVEGAGNSVIRRDYEAIDHQPLPGVSYYRLKQTDYDGAFTYSEVVRIENAGAPKLMVYPNPTAFATPTYIRLANVDEAVVSLEIFDVAGRLAFSRGVDLSDAKEIQTLLQENNTVLQSGTYLITVRGRKFRDHERLIVK
jgi:fibronectin-binding autotransporter adhesin